MKWIIVLATLLLAAGSGMAYQHDGDGGKVNGAGISNHTQADAGLGNTDSEDNETGIRDKTEIRQKIKNRKEEVREKIEERLQNKLHLKEGNGTGNNGSSQDHNIKEQIKEKIKQARSATDNAKQKYMEAHQMYLKSRQDKALQAHIHARTMMKNGVNYIDTWLERIELQTLNSDVDNETKLAILNEIDHYRNLTTEKMEKINNTTDMSEMREIARELNYQWKDARLFIKATGYQIAAGELENIIDKAENLEPRLEEMRSKASNTTKFDLLVSDYQHNLQMAEENVEQAQDILANATTVQDVMEGHKLVVKATNDLKQIFKDIRLIKNELD